MLVMAGLFCLVCIFSVAGVMAVWARDFTPAHTSAWYKPSIIIGGLGDLFVGFMVWFVVALTLSGIVIYPSPPAAPYTLFMGLWGIELVLFIVVTSVATVGYRWLRMRGARLSRRSMLMIGMCIVWAVLLHYISVKHGYVQWEIPGDPTSSYFWFAWLEATEYGKFGQTFAPRFTSLPYSSALCFTLGIVVPPVLFGVALFLLFRSAKRNAETTG